LSPNHSTKFGINCKQHKYSTSPHHQHKTAAVEAYDLDLSVDRSWARVHDCATEGSWVLLIVYKEMMLQVNLEIFTCQEQQESVYGYHRKIAFAE